jgi:zinc transport system permease protein
MSLWHQLIGSLPGEWAQLEFMRLALLAVLLAAPLYAVLGCLVVNSRMAFFSEAIGHAALTGVALGTLAGLADPTPAVLLFSAALALAIAWLRKSSAVSSDTIIGLVMAGAVALGVVLLSRGGGFNRYTRFLIGDLLTITPGELAQLAVLAAITLLIWGVLFNRLFLATLHPVLARSRGVNVWAIEALFSVLIALVVAISIAWIGLLVINSLLILPAAAARNLAKSAAAYLAWALLFSFLAGVAGLVISFYAATATGATIVLAALALFVLTLPFRRR